MDTNIGLILGKKYGKIEMTEHVEKSKKASSKELRVEIKDRIYYIFRSLGRSHTSEDLRLISACRGSSDKLPAFQPAGQGSMGK